MNEGTLSESILGDPFTDASPFTCSLVKKEQQVKFTFNDATTDPSTNCKYALTYKNNDTGKPLSSPQTLDCSNASLSFTTTATPDAGDSNCRGLPTITEDPQMQLTTTTCGDVVD